MSDYISAELAATCDALGYYDGATYHLDSDALNVIKDLIKYLKRDDDTHIVRRYLGQAKLLETDLIKILTQFKDNEELWDVLLRLMINLTSPALMLYNDELPTERTNRNFYLQLVSYLQSYKKALTDDRVWSAVSNRLGNILNIDYTERGEENELIIERILTLIRNVLQVPPHDNDKRADNDATVHDELLFALHTSGIVNLLLFIASNSTEQQFHMQIIEIIALMLREQNASKLATVGLQRSVAEKEREEAKLLAIRRREITEKMEKMRKYTSARHSRFGGTFVVQNMKAIGENQLICHKPFQKIESLNFSHDKVKVKKPKNKVLIEPPSEERMSALSVRLFLKEFCMEFLIGAYNPVMRHAKSCIIGESNADKSDASHYLWAMRFFMEFNRYYKFQVKYVSETISTEIFYVAQRQMEQYYEMIISDKKRTLHWSKRLHLALKAYQELLHTLSAMDKTTDKGVRDSSKVIKSNVFHVPEYRETILSQLLCYDRLKMSRSYLMDLLITVHLFLKMLEQFCAQGRSIIVAKTKKPRKKVNKSKMEKEQQQPATLPAKSFDERWDEAGPELSAVMQEGTIPDVVPFDAASDLPIDEQKSDAMIKIQKLLRRKKFEEAIGLLRAARIVWPENDCFGNSNMPVEEEFLALREIFFADLGVVEDEAEKRNEEDVENFLNNEGVVELDDDEDNEEEEAEREMQYEETNFIFTDFVQRFANVKVVRAMAILLQHFDGNSVELNRCILKLLHRIAWDCKMPGMLFQASIFRIFQRILESKHSEHKELQKFAFFIIRQFKEVAEKNRKAYMELLFWKNTREATEMVDGYDVQVENKKVSHAVWSDAEEDELRTLFMEHQTNKYTQDLIDWLLENIISEDRTRRSIIKKLKEMHLIVNSKRVKDAIQKRLPKEWGEAEILQLTEMWEKVKDDDYPIDFIYGGLTIKRPKPKIKEKLLELGLVKDKKELRKKRKKKNDGSRRASWEVGSTSGRSSDENSTSDDDLHIFEDGEEISSDRPIVKRKNFKKSMNKRSKKQPTIVYTDAQLSGLLKDVIDKNMREALEWIKESLEEATEDRDEESIEGIPVVPLTDYSSAAMDSPSFQRLLRAIGIEPPANEQEAYWRIPATMLSATIRKRCNLITSVLNGNYIIAEPVIVEKRNIDSDVDDIDNENSDITPQPDLERIKKMFSQEEMKSKTRRPLSEFLDSSDDNSEKEEVPEIKIAELNTESHGKKIIQMKTKVIMDDSSDSDVERESNHVNAELKRNRSDNSDTETPTLKKRRVIDSDEESNNENASGVVESKQARTIVSDDED